MRGAICQKDSLFFFFSTISDMVESPVLPRAEFEAWWLHQVLADAKEELAPRIERAIAQGSSSREGESAYDVVRGNAERVSLKKILERKKRLGGMGFAMALGLLKAGASLRRSGWERHVVIEDRGNGVPILSLKPSQWDGIDPYHPCSDDVLAGDWEVAS